MYSDYTEIKRKNTRPKNSNIIEDNVIKMPLKNMVPENLEEKLNSRLIGQSECINRIIPYIDIFSAEMNYVGRPAGIFLLLGPTGTGKSLTPEILAEVLHGSANAMIRVDCAEYQHGHEISKIIGSPPGYLGFKETKPTFNNEILKSKASERCKLTIISFDEIEKGHPDLHKLLLGIMDKGTLTLGDNTKVDFTDTLIFFTSNLGVNGIRKNKVPVGLAPGGTLARESLAMKAAKNNFSAEFMNRIDECIVFDNLNSDQILKILDLQINKLQKSLNLNPRFGNTFRIGFTDKAKEYLVTYGFSEEYGARELKRIIQRCVIHKLASLINANKLGHGESVYIDVDKSKNLIFKNIKQMESVAGGSI